MIAGANIPYWRLSAFYFCYFAFLGAWVPYWNLYLDSELSFNAWQIGLISALVLGTKIIGPYCWGLLADHFGHRIAIIRLGALLSALFFVFVVWVTSFWLLTLLIVLYSFFWNAVLSQFEVVTLDYLKEQSQRYSQIRLWGSLGFIAAVFGFGLLFDVVSISALPGLLCLLLLSILLASFCVNEPSHDDVQEYSGRHAMQVFWRELNQPGIWVFFAACFLLQLSHGPYYTFFSIYLQELGYSAAMTGFLWALGVLAEVLLFIYVHHLMARFDVRYLLLLTLLLSGFRWLLIAMFADNLSILLFAQLLHAASFGLMHASAIEMVNSHFSRSGRGQAQAFYSAVSFGAGGIIGALLSGYFWPMGAMPLFVMAAAFCGLAFLLLLLFSRRDNFLSS